MLTCDHRRRRIRDQRGLNARMAIRRDAHADPCRANQDADVSLPRQDTLRNAIRVVRVIHRVRTLGAKILHLIARALQIPSQGIFQSEAAVIGSNGKFAWQFGCRFSVCSHGKSKKKVGQDGFSASDLREVVWSM